MGTLALTEKFIVEVKDIDDGDVFIRLPITDLRPAHGEDYREYIQGKNLMR